MGNKFVESAHTALGIELGSTRIKSVLIDTESYQVLANGVFDWENQLQNGLWTYALEDAVSGLRASYLDLKRDVKEKYGVTLKRVGSIGISAMMHGYVALNAEGRQIAPFLTWRNTNTNEAATKLIELFNFNIPLRWSISQLYQAILNNEDHVKDLAHVLTLAAYIHSLLSGKYVLGVGDASGMFPIAADGKDFDADMIAKFSDLIADKKYPWKIKDILPKVLLAGEDAGSLTPEGAALLDPSGDLEAGIPMVPPEGDAGTGMTATNSVEESTGNVSAGTSIFSMVVLQKPLSQVYRDIDIVTTPTGRPVAMVHCNNGASEIDAWAHMFGEFASACGMNMNPGDIYPILFNESLKGESDCGGVLVYNYPSGEPVVGLLQGRPLVMRRSDSKLSLANFMRSQIFATMAALAVGMEILKKENVRIKALTGHGGLFKTPNVAQNYLAAAMNSPVTVMETAGEGGAYGMALLAAYAFEAKSMSLEKFLSEKVFVGAKSSTYTPTEEECRAYEKYLAQFKAGLAAEQAAVNSI